MKKFIVIYHAPKEFADQMSKMSPEDMKKGMEPWMTWGAKSGEGLVDMGTPLGNGQMVTKSGTVPSNKDVVGYSILQAENMGEAVEMLEGHPHLTMADSCSIEVHESMAIPM